MARTIRYVPRDARRLLILFNAKAGARANLECIEDLRRRLERDGMQVEMLTDLSGSPKPPGRRTAFPASCGRGGW